MQNLAQDAKEPNTGDWCALTGVVIDVQAAGVHHGRGRPSLLATAATLIALDPTVPLVRLGARLDGLHGLPCPVVAPQVGGALHHGQQLVDQLQWGVSFVQVKWCPCAQFVLGNPESCRDTSCCAGGRSAVFM